MQKKRTSVTWRPSWEPQISHTLSVTHHACAVTRGLYSALGQFRRKPFSPHTAISSILHQPDRRQVRLASMAITQSSHTLKLTCALSMPTLSWRHHGPLWLPKPTTVRSLRPFLLQLSISSPTSCRFASSDGTPGTRVR